MTDCKRMFHFLNLLFQIPHPTQAKVKFSTLLAWVMVKCWWLSRADVDVLNWLAHYRGHQKINPSDLMFRSGRESAGYKFNIPTCADTRLIHYYYSLLCLCRKKVLIFSINSQCLYWRGLNRATWTCIQSPERTIHAMYMDRSDAKLKY